MDSAVTPQPTTDAPTACKHTVSGTISLAVSAFFSPFPHGTCPLSVIQMYLALADGAAGFRQDFTGPVLLRITTTSPSASPTGLSPSVGLLSRQLRLAFGSDSVVLLPPARLPRQGLGWVPFARHYLGHHYCFLLLLLLRCFSSEGSPSLRNIPIARDGFPHSDTRGSTLLCSSPQIFAA